MSSDDFFINQPVRDSKSKLSVKQIVIALCRSKGLKLSELAKKVGITRQSLNAYTNGRWTAPTQIKIKIAQALEVDSAVIWDLEVLK